MNDRHLIIFCGMMKSGNHAIIKWVFENILRNLLPENMIESRKLAYNENVKIGNLMAFYNDVTRNPPPLNYITPCRITMVSLEEEYTDFDKIPILKGTKWKTINTVFIFRDLKNMVASRKKSKEYSEQFFGDTKRMCDLWKKMREDYVKVKMANMKNCFGISYDEVVSDGDSDLIEDLNWKKKLRFDQVPRITSNNHKPGWSSFQDDKFTERHKQLSNEDVEFIDQFLKQVKK